MVKKAEADGISMVKSAAADESVIKLQSLEAFKAAANGPANKLIIPAELQNMAGVLASAKEML